MATLYFFLPNLTCYYCLIEIRFTIVYLLNNYSKPKSNKRIIS
ncbi:hypothetical protein BACCELL_02278 [Bacteroides cellulosilyticus DSM 14838]|uniref:Uncharacterized protein n=1 Tax=Bacteroides cellulosilyticus DSM 14838 TaxID=537012 RepID=E2NDB9_9BACE|nr:hypothetical protein BACCELL_02278 [Bacteroides cellulosilyticus DSM 14838]